MHHCAPRVYATPRNVAGEGRLCSALRPTHRASWESERLMQGVAVGKSVGVETRARTIAFGLVMIFVFLLFGLQDANPADAATTFTVNSTGDEADKSPGDGVCQITTADQCTLRAAIEESNAFAGADTITFDIPGSGV